MKLLTVESKPPSPASALPVTFQVRVAAAPAAVRAEAPPEQPARSVGAAAPAPASTAALPKFLLVNCVTPSP
ncbi:hypothetical protein GCM10023195_38230 [Actinoallomurus liliacearum]|uniref:Uncharacterized protein n=1 Tax=Actinoallomurus liliacearum TaxID=1080073 RepID=A0ABP8TMD9_9ACTN